MAYDFSTLDVSPSGEDRLVALLIAIETPGWFGARGCGCVHKADYGHKWRGAGLQALA
jgi:hypothetical protein